MSTLIMRSALLPRFSLNHAQIRTILTLSAFEKAMQEIHGDCWKEKLSRKQKSYVQYKEKGRETHAKNMQDRLGGDKWEAAAAEEAAKNYADEEFQDKVQRLKEKLSKQEQTDEAA